MKWRGIASLNQSHINIVWMQLWLSKGLQAAL
jgi:hypothetical protein